MRKLFLGAMLTAVFFSGSAQANDYTIVSSHGTLAIITLPTALLAGSTDMAIDGPAKENFIRVAAAEAALVLAGEQVGPNLGALIDANEDRTQAEVINLVLEGAQQI